jgi:hypothetical protein
MKKQYKTTFDEGTEQALWKVAFKHRKNVSEMMRIIVARDAEIQAEAVNEGVSIQPETVGWGGKREVKHG